MNTNISTPPASTILSPRFERDYTRVILRVPAVYPLLRFVGLPSAPNVGLQLLLPRPNPRLVMLLGNAQLTTKKLI